MRSSTAGSSLSFWAASRSSAALRTVGSRSASAADSVAGARSPDASAASTASTRTSGEPSATARPIRSPAPIWRAARTSASFSPSSPRSNIRAIAAAAAFGASAPSPPTARIAISRTSRSGSSSSWTSASLTAGHRLALAAAGRGGREHARGVGADRAVGIADELDRDLRAVLRRIGAVGDARHDQPANLDGRVVGRPGEPVARVGAAGERGGAQALDADRVQPRVLGEVRGLEQVLDHGRRLLARQVREDLDRVAPRPALLAPQLGDAVDRDADVAAALGARREALRGADPHRVVLGLGHLVQPVLVDPAGLARRRRGRRADLDVVVLEHAVERVLRRLLGRRRDLAPRQRRRDAQRLVELLVVEQPREIAAGAHRIDARVERQRGGPDRRRLGAVRVVRGLDQVGDPGQRLGVAQQLDREHPRLGRRAVLGDQPGQRGGRGLGVLGERRAGLGLGALALRRRRLGVGEHRDRVADRRRVVGRRRRDLDQELAARRRVGALRQRLVEQRAAALAEAAHRRERDPPQLGVVGGQRPGQGLAVDVAAALRGVAGGRDRRALDRGRRRLERGLDQLDLGGRAPRDRPQRGEQLGEVLGILGRLAQGVQRRLVAGGRVLDQPGELGRHDLGQLVAPAAPGAAARARVDLLPLLGRDHRAGQPGVGDLVAEPAGQPEERVAGRRGRRAPPRDRRPARGRARSRPGRASRTRSGSGSRSAPRRSRRRPSCSSASSARRPTPPRG